MHTTDHHLAQVASQGGDSAPRNTAIPVRADRCQRRGPRTRAASPGGRARSGRRTTPTAVKPEPLSRDELLAEWDWLRAEVPFWDFGRRMGISQSAWEQAFTRARRAGDPRARRAGDRHAIRVGRLAS